MFTHNIVVRHANGEYDWVHNLVVRHANGEYEGFSGCGSTSADAGRNAKAKAARAIGEKGLDPALVSYLTKQEFDLLDDGTKATVRRDWNLSETGLPIRCLVPGRSRIQTSGRLRPARFAGAATEQETLADHDALEPDDGDWPGDAAELFSPAREWGAGSSAYSRISRIVAPPGARGLSVASVRRYDWGGELLTKAQMLSKAVAKEIVFMANEDAPTFHAVMDEPEGELLGDERSDKAGVFPITQAEYYRLRAVDATTPKARERYLDFRIADLSQKLSMQDRVDFSSWARRNNPSPVEKVGYLERVVFGLSSTPATFAPRLSLRTCRGPRHEAQRDLAVHHRGQVPRPRHGAR